MNTYPERPMRDALLHYAAANAVGSGDVKWCPKTIAKDLGMPLPEVRMLVRDAWLYGLLVSPYGVLRLTDVGIIEAEAIGAVTFHEVGWHSPEGASND